MRTWIDVGRFHLVNRFTYVALPWLILGFSFAVNLVIFAIIIPPGHGTAAVRYTGGIGSLFVYLFVFGLFSIVRSLPFGLALGVSRRSFYTGTALLAVTLAVVYGLALTLLQAIERVTDGWGLALQFFRLPWILDGPWYGTWLTSGVAIAMLFVYGMWFGIVYWRWKEYGIVAFVAAQAIVLLAGASIVTWTHTWPMVGNVLASLNPAGFTAVLAVLAAALLAGGYGTIHRATV